jgi:hypothetical protein
MLSHAALLVFRSIPPEKQPEWNRWDDDDVSLMPVAASVVTAQTIERYGITDAASIGYLVPQVSFEPSGGAAGGSLSIRGIGASGTDSGAEQTVVTVLDWRARHGRFDILSKECR